eukprot:4719326-Pyramimonas_sp.AAC.1
MKLPRHMVHLLKSPSPMTGGVADGLIRVWCSRVDSPISYWIGGSDGGCMAASAARLKAGILAEIGVAGRPARPISRLACRS